MASRKEVMPSSFHQDCPPSVKDVLNRIDTMQLLRAKEEISERLGAILRRVNETLEYYASDEDGESVEERDLSMTQLLSANKRREYLKKLTTFLQSSSIIEGGLENILQWLLDWNNMLSSITGEEELENVWTSLDEWIARQEKEINKSLDATQQCIVQLAELFYQLTGNDLRIRDKKTVSPAPLKETWIPEGKLDMRHVMKIQGIHPPGVKQMLQDEATAVLVASDLFQVLQDIALTPQCTEEQGSIYLCINVMIRNLSKAFDVRSKEYHDLESELRFLKAQKSKLKSQLMHLLKDFHQAQEDKKHLQIKLQGEEAKNKQLLLNMKSLEPPETTARLEQMEPILPTDSKQETETIPKKKKALPVKKEHLHAEKEREPDSDLQRADTQSPYWESDEIDTAAEARRRELKKAESQARRILDFGIRSQKEDSELMDLVDTKEDYDMVDSDVKAALDAKKGYYKSLRDYYKGFEFRKEFQGANKATQTDLDDGKGIQKDKKAMQTALSDWKQIQRKEKAAQTVPDDGKKIQGKDKATQTALDDEKGIQRGERTTEDLDEEKGFQRDEGGAETLDGRKKSPKRGSARKSSVGVKKEYLKSMIKSQRGLHSKKEFQEDESDIKATAMDQERKHDIKEEDLVIPALEEFQSAILSFLSQQTERKPSDQSLQAKQILPKNSLVLKFYRIAENKMKEILEKIEDNIYHELKEEKSVIPILPKSILELQKAMAEDLEYSMVSKQPKASLLRKASIKTITVEPEGPCTVFPSQIQRASLELEYSEISQLPRLKETAESLYEDESTWGEEKLQKQPEDEQYVTLSDVDQQVLRRLDMDYTIQESHQQMAALETRAEVVSVMERDSAVQMEQWPSDESPLTITQLQKSLKKLEKEDWELAESTETDERYCLDVKAQRENLERLSKACRMLLLPSDLHNVARDLILKILDTDATRLAHLFRKYISFRLIQNVRQILTVRANRAQSAGDMTELVGLYVFLERLDIYQAKILHRWLDKQTTTAETRSGCFAKMIYLFNKLRLNYKLHLFQPFTIPQLTQVKLEDFQSPYKQRLCPWTSQLQYFKPKLPAIQPELLVTKIRRPKHSKGDIWKPDVADEGFRIAEKQPVLSVWSKVGVFPDVPRLLELDVHFSKNKALQSLQMRVRELSK